MRVRGARELIRGRGREEVVDEKALKNLSLRIDKLKSKTEGEREREVSGGGLGGMGLGARVMVELVVAPCVGGGMGYSLDVFLGTVPFCMIGGVVLGSVAGVLNVKRLSDREDERVARVQEEGKSEKGQERRRGREDAEEKMKMKEKG